MRSCWLPEQTVCRTNTTLEAWSACSKALLPDLEQENGQIFEALKTMSAYFLRADATSICECIQAFGLNDLLFSIVRPGAACSRSAAATPLAHAPAAARCRCAPAAAVSPCPFRYSNAVAPLIFCWNPCHQSSALLRHQAPLEVGQGREYRWQKTEAFQCKHATSSACMLSACRRLLPLHAQAASRG